MSRKLIVLSFSILILFGTMGFTTKTNVKLESVESKKPFTGLYVAVKNSSASMVIKDRYLWNEYDVNELSPGVYQQPGTTYCSNNCLSWLDGEGFGYCTLRLISPVNGSIKIYIYGNLIQCIPVTSTTYNYHFSFPIAMGNIYTIELIDTPC